MPNIKIEWNARHPLGLLRSSSVGSEAGRYLVNALESAVAGTNQSDGLLWSVNDDT